MKKTDLPKVIKLIDRLSDIEQIKKDLENVVSSKDDPIFLTIPSEAYWYADKRKLARWLLPYVQEKQKIVIKELKNLKVEL